MKKLLFLLAIVGVTFLAGCRKEKIEPNYFGSKTARLAGINELVERKLGPPVPKFTKVNFLNGGYFKNEEAFFTDEMVKEVRSANFTWNNTWNWFSAPASTQFSPKDPDTGKQEKFFWVIGTIPYGSGKWGPGLMLVRESGRAAISFVVSFTP